MTRYNFKFRDLVGPKRQKRRLRRASSRLARSAPGADSNGAEAPRLEAFTHVSWELPTVEGVLAFLVFAICFAILAVAFLWPRHYGEGASSEYDFKSFREVIEPVPRR